MQTVPYTGLHTIETFSGHGLDLLNPDARMLEVVDIAHGMSMVSRFAGQCGCFYSVAEHSVLVADLAAYLAGTYNEPQRIRLGALLHDAHEAYVGDVTTPLKRTMQDAMSDMPVNGKYDPYRRVADRLQTLINHKFGPGLNPAESALIKAADRWAFVIEARRVMRSGAKGYDIPDEIRALGQRPTSVKWYGGLLPVEAEQRWLTAWTEVV